MTISFVLCGILFLPILVNKNTKQTENNNSQQQQKAAEGSGGGVGAVDREGGYCGGWRGEGDTLAKKSWSLILPREFGSLVAPVTGHSGFRIWE